MRWMAFTAALALALDQASKLAILHLLNLRDVLFMDVWAPYLVFRYGENTGINFGLFDGGAELVRWALVGFSIVVCVVLWVWLSRPRHGTLIRVCGGLMIGGALGNAVDRATYGYVVDFLNMSCCGISNPYVFNVADIFIFAGVIGIVIFDRRDEPGKKAA
ncbi:MAG: signal peptidase II [Rhodobacteraceae bacterium]|nr:signal peptidase II [Paracoccaceae bacterium]